MADRSSTGKYRTLQSEGTGDVARQPESNQQGAARQLEPLCAGLVGILPASRDARTHFPTGGLDPTTRPELFLAAVAQRHRAGTCATTTGTARSRPARRP